MKLPSAKAPQKFIETLVSDLANQPKDFRQEMAISELYYDGHQIKSIDKEILDERGQPLLIYNLIHPTINGVLGMEAKTRRDWIVKADDKAGMEVAELLNERVNEVARISHAQRACSDAFARQTKGGLGWVEVRRNDDPFGDPYIVEEVDWAEVWYDWHSKRADLKDSRYVVREKWLDLDEAEFYMPHKAQLFKEVYRDWDGMNSVAMVEHLNPSLVSSWSVQQETTIQPTQWQSADRKRRRFFEVWYRKPVTGLVMDFNGQVMEFDEKNDIHQAMYRGGADVRRANYTKMYRAIFCGPHLMHNGPSPYPHNEFPLIPFFGYREGRSRVPYGLIRNMISAQDGVNFRHSMLTWILKARRVLMIEGATTMSDVEVQEQLSRMDGIIKLNPKIVKNLGMDKVFKIDSELGVASQQFQMMQQSQEMIQNSAGVYNAMLGKSDSGATSGIAINSLVEQGSITLSELYDNYAFARQQVGWQLAHLEADALKKRQERISLYTNSTKPTKHIDINQPQADGLIKNEVTMLKKHVVIADIHTTAGYQQQMIDRLMQLMQSLPENVQPLLLMKVIELSELPGKDELIKAMNQLLGLSQSKEDLNEEELAQVEQQEQMQQVKAQMQQVLEQEALRAAKLENDGKEVEMNLKQANAILAGYRAKHEQAKTEQTYAGIQQTSQQMDHADIDKRAQLDAQLNAMFAQMPQGAAEMH